MCRSRNATRCPIPASFRLNRPHDEGNAVPRSGPNFDDAKLDLANFCGLIRLIPRVWLCKGRYDDRVGRLRPAPPALAPGALLLDEFHPPRCRSDENLRKPVAPSSRRVRRRSLWTEPIVGTLRFCIEPPELAGAPGTVSVRRMSLLRLVPFAGRPDTVCWSASCTESADEAYTDLEAPNPPSKHRRWAKFPNSTKAFTERSTVLDGAMDVAKRANTVTGLKECQRRTAEI